MSTIIRILAAALVLAFGVAAAKAEDVRITIGLEPETSVVFDWSRDACDTWDVPDAPARAFRTADGQVRLIAATSTNRALVGPDLDHLKRDCKVMFRGGESDAFERYDDRAWLHALYSPDGRKVYALVHNEFQGNHRPTQCPSGIYIRCWRNTITFAVSDDGGVTFHQPAAHLVATPPYRYVGDFGRNVGYFNPTNIISRDGAYYAMFSAAAYREQPWGACLMRTGNLDDPSAWRAWNGHDFTVAFRDPYRTRIDDPAASVCTPVGVGKLITPLGGIVLHKPSGYYLLTMAGTRRPSPGEKRRSGVWIAASRDLITWSDPVLALELPTDRAGAGTCPVETYHHPSLIDPTSEDRNFGEMGETADLYLMVHHFKSCKDSPDRDLLKRRIRIEVTAQ